MGLARHHFDERAHELLLRVEAASLPELFAEAGGALAESMHATPLAPVERWSERVELEAVDPEALLVEWLNTLVLRAEVEKVLFTEFEIERLFDGRLAAVIRGRRVARLRNPVKAATYHGLSLVEHAGRVAATVLLDV